MRSPASAWSLGREDGRASALSVILPLRWWAPMWLRIVFGALRWGPARRFAYDKLDRLCFVSAIRWSLLPAFAGRRPQLLFESNFDGDWDEYLENFASATPRALWFILVGAAGYPGLGSPSVFKTYARERDNDPIVYLSGYPTLTSGDVRELLYAEHGERARRNIVRREAYGRREPQWSTFLARIAAGRADEAITVARALSISVAEDVPSLHFLRVHALVRPGGDWLLITATHDGSADAFVGALAHAAAGWIQRLLACCDPADAPSTSDAAKALLDLRLSDGSSRSAAYCSYGGASAPYIRVLAANPPTTTKWPVRR